MTTTAVNGLPRLFSRRSDGKVQFWQIEVQGDGYRTHSGIVDGETVTSEWTRAVAKNVGAKNATTPAQQAEAEARSQWKKKCDKGYKPDVADIDNVGFFEPMLAHTWEDYKDEVRFPVWVQPKLDGMRCVARKDGLWSRNGKPILSAPHIAAALAPLFQADPELVPDGEMYADKFADDFNKVMSLARKTKPTAAELAESAAHLEYHIYDLPRGNTLSGPQAPFSERHRALTTLLTALNHVAIKRVETVLVYTQEQMDELYGRWVEAGYEGQMIRLDGPYEQKRSKLLLKRKEFQDEEFQILDIQEGVGNRSGMAGYLVFKTAAGRPFRASIKGNRAYFRQLLATKSQFLGRLATVKYFQMTPDGSPRFPVVTQIRDE